MGKKFMNTVLFLAVAAAAATLTAYVGKGSGNVLFYNFAFLGIMVIIYAVGLFAGLYRMDNLTAALRHGASEITEVFQLPGRARKEEISQLRGFLATNIWIRRWMILSTASAGQKKELLRWRLREH